MGYGINNFFFPGSREVFKAPRAAASHRVHAGFSPLLDISALVLIHIEIIAVMIDAHHIDG